MPEKEAGTKGKWAPGAWVRSSYPRQGLPFLSPVASLSDPPSTLHLEKPMRPESVPASLFTQKLPMAPYCQPETSKPINLLQRKLSGGVASADS